MNVYVLLYINIDEVSYSEVLGVFTDKNKAVSELLDRANYREKNGKLTQNMDPCDEYESFSCLWNLVYEQMELYDVDIYRIEIHNIVI
jgi:hypothetical protein